MYIPKFRTAEDVVGYFRERDPKSIISCGFVYYLVRKGKISGFDLGRKCVVNLDEVLFYLSGAVGFGGVGVGSVRHGTVGSCGGLDKRVTVDFRHGSNNLYTSYFRGGSAVDCNAFACNNAVSPLIVTAKTAYRMVKENDPGTKLSRDVIRRIVGSGALKTFVVGSHLYFDFHELMAYLSPTCFAVAPKKVPRLRTYENTYHRLKKYTKLPITWSKLHAICHSGEVLCEHYGNRLVVDYDAIKARLQCIKPT